jgi:hypothetical protein
MADPDLSPTETIGSWRWRGSSDEPTPDNAPRWLGSFAAFVAFVVENMLWIALAIALLLVLLSHRRWLPWFTGRSTRVVAAAPDPVEVQALPLPLPQDLTQAVLACWRDGHLRAALSLFYRGALSALVERVGSPLPPGATEADSLRHARRLSGQPFAIAFRQVVGCWQAAAYAHRLPSESELQRLLTQWRDAEHGG